jgi:hypothetical protein
LQKQEDTQAAGNAGITTTEPDIMRNKMLVAIRHSLSDTSSSNDGEDGEYEDDEEREEGQVSEDDEPGCVMHKITNTVLQRIEQFWQQQMKLDDLIQLEWEDEADNFGERD